MARDLWELFHTLKTAQRHADDDGTVRGHPHVEDDELVEVGKT